ncbi:hypothetical protein [Desulfovibrio inopinatus]|uniref:hypothetical protein n=1 Tax=Desulfovibrio inopinatus TaxID=102109 RepID=UPI000482B475|nr:hypothetical protein [Desulfovibrio inopinatus]
MARVIGAKPRVLYEAPQPFGHFGSLLALRPGNYFTIETCLSPHHGPSKLWLTVRVSRSSRPFWGLRDHVVRLFHHEPDWLLVLLRPGGCGWLYNKTEIQTKIRTNRWRVANDDEYKINPPLDATNRFETLHTLRQQIEDRIDCLS